MPRTPEDQNEAQGTAYRLAVRFGDEILQAGFTTVPNLLLRYQATLKIAAPELTFILQVWYHWWDQKDPYPALPTIAERMGQSRRQVNRYVESLKKKRYLKVHERRESGRGQVTSEYDFSGLLDQLRELYRQEQSGSNGSGSRTNLSGTPLSDLTRGGVSSMSRAPLSSMSTEEYSGTKKTQLEKDSVSSKGKSSDSGQTTASRFSKTKVADFENKPDPDLTRRPKASGASGLQPIGNLISLHRAQQLAQMTSEAPVAESKPPRRGTKRERAPQATDWIRADIERYSDELHDTEHTPQNIGQAARLFEASGLSEAAFCQLMGEARSITKGATIKKRAIGPGGEYGFRNKMPYFFKVLRDLLGMKDENTRTHPAVGPPS